jgi:hypothetical protein
MSALVAEHVSNRALMMQDILTLMVMLINVLSATID